MVEMGTFVAILLGQVAGGLLVAIPQVGPSYVAAACLGVAVLGRLTAQSVPASPSTDPGLRINWNPVSETWRNLKLAHGNLVVFRSLLGISWMWFFGAVFLAEFPSFAKEVLHGDEHVASLLLVVFSVGIGIGSLLCEVLSRRHVEIGLVPLGAIGMSIFAVDLYFASRSLAPASAYTLQAFVAQPAHWRVLADLFLLSLFAGLYSVPMYALIQMRSQPSHRARIIAANNILNALFIIVSAVMVGVLLKSGLSVPQVFLVVGLLNAVVAFYIFMLVPEYLLRFVAFLVARLVYRFRVKGDENIPAEGAAILVCNHVSFVDPVLLMGASPRPIRFIMDHEIFKLPVLGTLFKLGKAIPIAAAEGRPAHLRAGLRAGSRGAEPRRPALHLSRRRPDEGRRARRVQGRRHEAARVEPGAGRAARLAEPLGVVLLARRRQGDEPAVPARPVQPRRPGGRRAASLRPTSARRACASASLRCSRRRSRRYARALRCGRPQAPLSARRRRCARIPRSPGRPATARWRRSRG